MKSSWFLWTCLSAVPIGAALLSGLRLPTVPPAVAQEKAASQPAAEPVYKVVSPLGESVVKTTAMAPRLKTLAGKTVGLVWNR